MMPTHALDTTKLALVYLRQSTPGQVVNNVIATQEQYRLREIPEALGFPAERILVVDEDLGVSGQTITGRKGMLRVLELLEQSAAACVVVRDVARLTRDEFNADIGLIARACYHAGARIITKDKIYDPGDPSDQLLLGFQGLLAGWDRANIARRLEHHRRAKQARGVHINGAVPPGYEKIVDVARTALEHGKLRITRDEGVRDRVALVLRKGLEFGGVLAVVRYLRIQGLEVPVVRGGEPREVTGDDGIGRVIGTGRRVVQWAPATRDRVTRILKNPAYAGAIVNGRKIQQRDRATGRARWVTRRPYEDCTVIRNAHEAYISWDDHHRLLGAIARNNLAKTYGDGSALLSGLGLARCGVCGAPMVVQYNNPRRRDRRGGLTNATLYTYTCSRRDPDGRQALCQNPAGPHIDRITTDLVLFGLGELNLDGLQEAMRGRDRRIAETERLRLQRVEVLGRRAQMLEDAIGDAATPVARTRLVARFETVLGELETARAAAVAPVDAGPPLLSPELLARLEALRDPSAAWERFSLKTRKEVLRALASQVSIYPDIDGYFVVIDWRGGGRAAGKVKTIRRKKIYAVPEEVLALFENQAESRRSMASRP